ncbi:hypothetical protein J4E90_003791 [Alternaria incomplexa]|uniref:uncharacterized protein n=1 Tax=Alternaria incomplexa TaxID=1187928 RepID=UPI0022209C4A|nr:uncharacterized protein J4E90_003791 [Alternaria incomplexa]KAI4917284.1 hypothetical protein J4E90_003791 [Alternaria incomplexa]
MGKVLQFVSHDEQHSLPTTYPGLKTAILGALHVALDYRNEEALEIILERFTLLGYCLDDGDAGMSNISAPGFTDRRVLEALENANWTLAANLIIAQKSKASLYDSYSYPMQCQELKDALKKLDLRLAYHWYGRISQPYKDQFLDAILKLAISLHDSAIAITIIEDMEEYSQRGAMGVAALLEHGQTAIVSSILMRHPAWKSALDSASGPNDFGALEAMFFHGSAVPLITNPEAEHVALTLAQLQLCFRIVAYHAMEKNDYKLCTWLLQVGMEPDEFHLLWNEDYDYRDLSNWSERIQVQKHPVMHCSLPGGIGKAFDHGENPQFTLPSLLAVAAEQSNIRWLKYLVTEGISVVDSMALWRAIKSRATIATLRFLIDAAKARKSSAERSYGIAALRQAIRYRDISRIDVLCGAVNVDEIGSFTEEFLGGESAINPLGEAIIADDSETVQLLLRHRASPNAYVSFDGLMLGHITSHMRRVTPLLAAIDVQSLPLVKILVQHGAELQYTSNMGISRTPLQRAAETGSFEIVEYLVDQGAIIDTNPVYSGGTALQLAAMNGFCGIAAFLLEHEADPHYAPAKGHGRTAFEAAAEWGHVDTMSLLMQWKVDLDAQFGEPPESQYERARRFAEKNGFMASKRFVEHLYGQRTRDESWHAGLALDWM